MSATDNTSFPIAPRIGTLSRLLEDDAEIDMARALYLDVTGQGISERQTLEERTFVVDLKGMAARWGYFRRGRRSTGGGRPTAGGATEQTWFGTDDLSRFCVMCLRLCGPAILRQVGRARQTSDRAQPRYRSRARNSAFGSLLEHRKREITRSPSE